MGATPVSALNLVAFSLEELGERGAARDPARGGRGRAEAGVAILGGHSIEDAEPKFGLAVTGVVHPDEVLTNAGGRAGDALVLTKPLGAGAVSTAVKRGLPRRRWRGGRGDDDAEPRRRRGAARAAGAHAMTDVTGFGLLGHLHELALASGVAAEVDAAPCRRSTACWSCWPTPTSARWRAERGATGRTPRQFAALRRRRARGPAVAGVRRDDLGRPAGGGRPARRRDAGRGDRALVDRASRGRPAPGGGAIAGRSTGSARARRAAGQRASAPAAARREPTPDARRRSSSPRARPAASAPRPRRSRRCRAGRRRSPRPRAAPAGRGSPRRTSSASAAPLAPSDDGIGVRGGGRRGPADAADREQREHRRAARGGARAASRTGRSRPARRTRSRCCRRRTAR